MRKPFLILLFFGLLSVSTASAQLGLGLGTSGVSLKPFHEYTLFTSFRTGFGAGYSIESFDFSFTPEITGNIKLLQRDNYFLYGGLGLKGFTRINVGSADDIYNFTFYFMMPFGIECRPIPGNDNLAICLETQVNFARSGVIDPGIFGVLEVVYYFNLFK
ncbi:MAG: hypothetical protein JW801_14295 [Bacteroidales bacterium]|nr:hypothetical protein [Bacteroidales bacterium]